MTEEIKDQEVLEVVETTEVEEEVTNEESSEVKKELPKGYIDDEAEFKKKFPGKEFISADEYKRNGSLFKKIMRMEAILEKQEQRNRHLESQLKEKALKVHQERMFVAAQNDNKAEFDRLKKEEDEMKSSTENNVFTQEDIDQMNVYQQDHSEWADPTRSPENRDMVMFMANKLKQSKLESPELSMYDHLKIAETALKTKYHHRFENKNRKTASAVAGAVSGGAVSSKPNLSDVPPNLKKAAELYIKAGGTLKEYKQLMGI